MIEEHGREAIFLKIFDVIVTHPEANIIQLQKKVLRVLLKDQYKEFLNPFSENDEKRETIRFSDKEDQSICSAGHKCYLIRETYKDSDGNEFAEFKC